MGAESFTGAIRGLHHCVCGTVEPHMVQRCHEGVCLGQAIYGFLAVHFVKGIANVCLNVHRPFILSAVVIPELLCHLLGAPRAHGRVLLWACRGLNFCLERGDGDLGIHLAEDRRHRNWSDCRALRMLVQRNK